MQNSNLFWAGLSTIASKRFDRDLLVVGQHDLSYRITDQDKHTEKISGVLTVSPNQVRSTNSKPKTEDIVAAILYRIGEKKRAEIVRLIASEGLIFDDKTDRLSKTMINELSTQLTSSVRGALAFSAN